MSTKLQTQTPALLLSIALASVGLAQNTQPPTRAQTQSAEGQSTAQTGSELSAPVLHIKSVEIIRSAHAPIIDIIRVRGVASTEGWEEAELIPLSRGIPADGIL